MSFNKFFYFFKAFFCSFCGVIIYFLGGFDYLIRSLLIIIVLDYITGVLKALYNKCLNSVVGFYGILKKFFILIVVASSVVIESFVSLPVREIVIMFFVANEGLSILENVSSVLPVPKKLKDVLEQLQDSINNDNDME